MSLFAILDVTQEICLSILALSETSASIYHGSFVILTFRATGNPIVHQDNNFLWGTVSVICVTSKTTTYKPRIEELCKSIQ
jgi:hypothetical protein